MESASIRVPITDEGKRSLIDRVTERTQGTKSDPLTREEVEQVCNALIAELLVTDD